MNKHYLISRFKSTGVAYLLWFFFGIHYAYLGKWGIQILYWVTCGGAGIWAFIDLFLIPGKVEKFNSQISFQIDQIERKEKEEELQRNMMFASQMRKNQNE